MARLRGGARGCRMLGLALLCVCFVGRATAQGTVSQASVTAELQALSAAAHTIFVGQIIAIHRGSGVVEVAFQVEQPVAGAAEGVFTLREWAGLWPPGQMRYSVGQRVLAFVHGASTAGFSSPVHGAEGLVPVVVQGADAPKLLDVRRVAAAVVRTPGTRLPGLADGAIALSDALAVIRSTTFANVAQPVRLPLPVHARPPLALPGGARVDQAGVPGSGEDEPVRMPVAAPR